MNPSQVTAFVMAGGKGSRLMPLTRDLPKPALGFANHCRIIDFVLSNLRNSGVERVYVLLQYKPMTLLEHLRDHWPAVRPLLPLRPFDGTAEAMAHALERTGALRSDVVAVLAADQIYRMDLRQMAAWHRQHRAGVTVAAVAVDTAQAHEFGVIEVEPDLRILEFQEKPAAPASMPGQPGRSLVSMGNYLFDPQVLAECLRSERVTPGLDFGRDVIPALVRRRLAWAYDFSSGGIPGAGPSESAAYWHDLGTLPALRRAEADTQGACPRFSLENSAWPVPATLATVRSEAATP